MPHATLRAGPLAAALLLPLAVACGDARRAPPPDAADARAPSAGIAATADSARDRTAADTGAFAGTTEPTERAGAGEVATLAAVRTARHAAFDRVVLEFAGDAVPGHAVAYEAAPRDCGSGDPVRVAGDAWLVVRLEPARAHTEAGESSIDRRRLAPEGAALRELAVSCDFEATLAWVLGLDRRRPYRVLALESPARLVVDVGTR